MENVRLTIQLRDEKNKIRVTMHKDTTISRVEEKAQEMAAGAARFFRKEKKDNANDTTEPKDK